MPVPAADIANAMPRISTINAYPDNCQFITDRRDLWPDLWRLNRAVAEAYGLDADDFAHVLKSFGALARKRPEFYAFLMQQTAEWATGLP